MSSSYIYSDQDLPEAIELPTIHPVFKSLRLNRNLDRKGSWYLCPVGDVVSPIIADARPGETTDSTPVTPQMIKEDQVVARANKAQRHINENHRSDESFIRIILRSLPFFAFILITTRVSEIASWSIKEKSALLVLIVALFASSVYAWWPRRRQ